MTYIRTLSNKSLLILKSSYCSITSDHIQINVFVADQNYHFLPNASKYVQRFWRIIKFYISGFPLCYFTLRSKWYETNILDVFHYLPNRGRMTISFVVHGWIERGHYSYVRYDIMQPEKWGNLFEAEVITAHHTHISTIELLNLSRSIITLCSFSDCLYVTYNSSQCKERRREWTKI